MKLFSTYSVKIQHYNHIFKETVSLYRAAVDFLIGVCLDEWSNIILTDQKLVRQQYVEHLCHQTKDNPEVKYPAFDRKFYKFPSYLRRSAISEALGKVYSYQSNLINWEAEDPKVRGRKPSFPKAGYVYPSMYRTVMYEQSGDYEMKIKVFLRNTWDWLTVRVRKSDMDYINHRCTSRKKCAPTLQKRGKEWFLDFPFEETVKLPDTNVFNQTILAVDLGINAAATVSVMRADGTILGRHFCRLPKEYDSLTHAINRIKKAQQHGNHRTPRLWARAKGINRDIAVKTAHFIMDVAALYNADAIAFEHLDLTGRKRGSKKQRLHLWRSQYVQSMVTDKAHRLGMRISHICAWGTSRLAYDGSGRILRGKEAELPTYSLCRFQNGKVYNCDLSASYNIGSRYFIRESLKSLPARERLALEAKVPQAAKRSTCTWSTLINLNAELVHAA
ncbi:transposase [Clostridium porci]|uniref:Transposase n=1 Tax=Clostridium porci TaxID=2605778 RepID=A0A7X2NNA1_9CLOT|nr:transposase [Clostridium porci]MSS38042.1 transposase [Clostridium porci]